MSQTINSVFMLGLGVQDPANEEFELQLLPLFANILFVRQACATQFQTHSSLLAKLRKLSSSGDRRLREQVAALFLFDKLLKGLITEYRKKPSAISKNVSGVVSFAGWEAFGVILSQQSL